MSETILVEDHGNWVEITLNRPDKYNAINREMAAELVDAFRKVREEAAVGVVVVHQLRREEHQLVLVVVLDHVLRLLTQRPGVLHVAVGAGAGAAATLRAAGAEAVYCCIDKQTYRVLHPLPCRLMISRCR